MLDPRYSKASGILVYIRMQLVSREHTTRRNVKKAKTISKTPKSESRRVQKGSERIRKVANMMGIAQSSSVGDTPNAPQKTNEPQSVKI